MKKILYVGLFLIVGFCICCATNVANVVDASKGIVGTWELRQTSAAMIPTPSTYPAGNGTTLSFINGTYKSYEKGVLVKSGTYTVVEDSTFEESVCLVRPEGQFRYRVIYDGDTASIKKFIQVSGNKLTVMSGCYAVDAGTNIQYEKIGNGSD